MKKKIKNILLACSLLPLAGFAQDTWNPAVKFYNVGAMNVATNGGSTSLYVNGSMEVGGASAILQNGITEIMGHFVQAAPTRGTATENHAFVVDAWGVGVGKGSFVFSGSLRRGTDHLITSTDGNDVFNRSKFYIAFPNIVVNTNDEVKVDSKMGIDAISVKQGTSKTGKLHLYSTSTGTGASAAVYDASLRIIGTGSSVASGVNAVILERNVSPYIDSVGVVNTPMFGFATPYVSQSVGYFAANWMSNAVDSNPTNFSTYITSNTASISPGDAKYVRIRDKSLDYYSAKNIIPALSGQDLNKTMKEFKFNNKFNLGETVYSADAITKTVSGANVIFGNSYSAPISLSKLNTAMGTNFDNYIYLFPVGATQYYAYDRSSMPATYSEISQTGIFMLKPTVALTSFSITKDLLTHGIAPHTTKSAKLKSLRLSSLTYYDQVSLTARLASNRAIFANTTVTIADGSSTTSDAYDALMYGFYPFGLWTLSSDGVALSANKTPNVADSIPLNFKVTTQPTTFDLDLTSLDLVKGDGFWLRDKQTGSLTQMVAGDTYTFSASPSDDANRFVIYLKNLSSTTGVETATASTIYAYCNLSTLNITRLTDVDMGSVVMIFDMQGRKLMETTVEDTPKQSINLSGLTTGAYILKIKGKRNYTTKFTVNN